MLECLIRAMAIRPQSQTSFSEFMLLEWDTVARIIRPLLGLEHFVGCETIVDPPTPPVEAVILKVRFREHVNAKLGSFLFCFKTFRLNVTTLLRQTLEIFTAL